MLYPDPASPALPSRRRVLTEGGRGLLALALFGAVSVARLSPLRAQDRLIRLEEQLRYARVLPADLAARAQAALSPRHYIALRFASDAELAGLVEMVIKNPALKGKEIKSKITTWRPDTFRV